MACGSVVIKPSATRQPENRFSPDEIPAFSLPFQSAEEADEADNRECRGPPCKMDVGGVYVFEMLKLPITKVGQARNTCAFVGFLAFCLIGGVLLAKAGVTPSNSTPVPISTNSVPGLDHAKLANDYIAQRKAESARIELEQAERLAPANNFDIERNFFQAYSNLHEVEPAIKHGRKCIALSGVATSNRALLQLTSKPLHPPSIRPGSLMISCTKYFPRKK
jgi:hypothetical protein